MAEPFSALLRAYRERAGRSRNSLALQVGVNAAYLSRIELGDRDPPRRHIVEALARGLRLSPADRNRLLVAAGYAPVELDGWPDALQAVLDVLADSGLPVDERLAFSVLVTQLAVKWRQSPLTVDVPVEVPVPDPRALTALGVMMQAYQRQQRPTLPDAETLRRQYCEEGLSVMALAHRHGVGLQRMRVWLRAAGIRLRGGAVARNGVAHG